jgi:photosystem II cytochrome c550
MIQPQIQAQIRTLRQTLSQTLTQSLGQFLSQWIWIWTIAMTLIFGIGTPIAQAAPDPYIAQYLKVQPTEIATLKQDATGQLKEFDYPMLVKGKELFGQNCQSCHVGGATLASPELPLSLPALQGATPPRDSIDSLVTYLRHPLSYNGDDDNYGCREIAKTWLADPEVEAIAAFVLRAAEKATGWGTQDF